MADGSRSCGAALQQWGGQWWSSDEKEGEWQKWSGEWWRRDGSGEWKKWRGDGSGSGNGGAAVTPAQRTVAPPGATAVAVQGGHGEMFTVDFFKNFRTFTGAYKQHNAALKWFRVVQERLDTPCDLHFSNTDEVAVAAIIKGKGMDFDFDETTLWSWSWLELVAQLDDESIDFVVKGPDDRSCGLWQCSLSMRPGSYDHKRNHMLIKQGTTSKVDKLKVWDFLLVRSDGSTVRLHPNWSNTFVDALEGSSHETEVEIPWSGLGGSDGPGTYAYYKELDVVRKLRFDARKHDRKGNKAK